MLIIFLCLTLLVVTGTAAHAKNEFLSRETRRTERDTLLNNKTLEEFKREWSESLRNVLTYDQYFFYYSGGYPYYSTGYSTDQIKDPYVPYPPLRTYEYGYGYGGGQSTGCENQYYTWGPRCERKEYRILSDVERHRLHRALNKAKQSMVGGLSQYDIFVAMHSAQDAPGAHRGAAFLPWHREFLMRFEQMLRFHEPDVCLPYWDSTLDSVLPTPQDSAIWTENYLGGNNGSVTDGPFSAWAVMTGCEFGAGSSVKRYTGYEGRCFTQADLNNLMSKDWYLKIVCQTDCSFENAHDEVHMYVGGHMIKPACSPSDPVFFLHHAFVDCMWEEFRTNSQVTDKELEYPTEGAGSNLSIGGANHEPFDRMEPWPELYNIHGLSDHYTNYYYNCAPRPHCSNNTCNSPALWCNDGVCTAKIKEGGYCSDYPDEACYGSNCYCENSAFRCYCTIEKVSAIQNCINNTCPLPDLWCNDGVCTAKIKEGGVCGRGDNYHHKACYSNNCYCSYIRKKMRERMVRTGIGDCFCTRSYGDEQPTFPKYPTYREPMYENDEIKVFYEAWRNKSLYNLPQTPSDYSYFYSIGQTYIIKGTHEYSDTCYASETYHDYRRAEYEYGYYQGKDPQLAPSENFFTWFPRCQRKEYRQLAATERNRLHDAINTMEQSGEWDVFVAIYRDGTSPGAHSGAAFLPWHREYLFRMEMALRMHDPQVCLPYWDSTLDSCLPVPRHSAIWTPPYLGNNQGFVTTGPFAGWTTNPGCSYSGSLLLGRSTGWGGRCILQSDIDHVMGKTTFQQLGCGVDCALESAHGLVHVFVGGQMGIAPCAPSDPIFFMHHAFIDYIWQKFREERQVSPLETEYPTATGGSGLWIGGRQHEPYARMHPWSHLYNIHGLSDHYTNYYYEYSPRPRHCSRQEHCGSDILFCHNGMCKAKVARGGSCAFLGNDACYCSRRMSPICVEGVCDCQEKVEKTPCPPDKILGG